MFTAKLTQDSVTIIVDLHHICIAKKDSVIWQEDWAVAKAHNCLTPDVIECITTVDGQDSGLFNETLNIVERQNVKESDCVGIWCITEPCDLVPEVEKGIPHLSYGKVFLYKGDELYITNQYGITVETMK